MGDLGEFDSSFIQALEHRPKPNASEAQGIPLIDLSPISYHEDVETNSETDPASIGELAKQVGSACRNWGFFQVINHGVPLDRRQRIEAVAREFFAQSLEEKRKVRRDEVKIMGYYDKEHTKNVRDWKEVFDFGVEDPTLVAASPDPDDDRVAYWNNQWPEYPPMFRETCEEYTRDVVKLVMKLMELIALSLGLPAKRFHEYFKDQTSTIRLNYYPPCPSPDLALGVGRHRDNGVLTVLAQDEIGGLQVKRRTDGEWIGVKPTPDAFIINVGDIMQVWTNEAYRSAEHRVVVNSVKERLSIPFFLNPAHYTEVKPVEDLIDEEHPPKYRPYIWGKFQVIRKRSNFIKLNVNNIQIDDFRIAD
ncbi:hypothetical protein PIB30_055459 [Stylosanthes scabra]|uniref:Fe2OG dioxygenase domain-containing protein n=1 Tax=Stylosanthes scabra TaxID=79078 RepID=A0ABU6YHZ5_9FABA|nr:hypothetical protein [Stylosanthes scabra]